MTDNDNHPQHRDRDQTNIEKVITIIVAATIKVVTIETINIPI